MTKAAAGHFTQSQVFGYPDKDERMMEMKLLTCPKCGSIKIVMHVSISTFYGSGFRMKMEPVGYWTSRRHGTPPTNILISNV